MRLNDLAHGRLDAPKLDPRDIVIRKGWNYRDVDSEPVKKHIAWLKESIRANGVQKPIEVEFSDGTAYLVDGECRLRAALALWKEGIEVYVPAMLAKGDEAEVRAKSMVANGALPPTQLEFGQAAAQLRAYGWDDDKIAAYTPPHIAVNKAAARRYVADAVELHHAPLEVKKAVQEGVDGVKVTPALALAATKQNRMMAGEILRNEAGKAKAAGKKVAHRPKAKSKKETKTVDLMGIGDMMAEAILSDTWSISAAQKLARSWQKARS